MQDRSCSRYSNRNAWRELAYSAVLAALLAYTLL